MRDELCSWFIYNQEFENLRIMPSGWYCYADGYVFMNFMNLQNDSIYIGG